MKFLKYWFPVILYCCMIFGVSAMPGKDVPQVVALSDKLVHAVEYALLSALFARALLSDGRPKSMAWVWVGAVCFVAFYGMTDEIHQSYVASRSSDVKDWLADITGGALGAFLYLFYHRQKEKSRLSTQT